MAELFVKFQFYPFMLKQSHLCLNILIKKTES